MATDMARRMVTEWGMSEKLGLVAYRDNGQEVFLGHSVTQNKNVSEATAREIDSEIRAIIDRAYVRAVSILRDNVEELHRLARGLLEVLKNEKRPVIVVGDFNTPDHGGIYKMLAAEFTDAFATVGQGYGETFPGDVHTPVAGFRPWLRLDYQFVLRRSWYEL